MIRWVILGLIVVGGTATAALVMQRMPSDMMESQVATDPTLVATGSAPKMVIDRDPIHNFKEMSQFDEATTSWLIQNDGEGPLQLTFTDAPCTCTHVRFGEGSQDLPKGSGHVIEPGEEASLYLTWETRDRGPHYHTHAEFVSNDPEQPSIQFGVEGLVFQPVVVYPNPVQLSEVTNDEPRDVPITIYSLSKPDLTIEPPKTSDAEHLKARIRPMTDEEMSELNGNLAKTSNPDAEPIEVKQAYILDLTIEPGMPLGDFNGRIFLNTDHPVMPRIDVDVLGRLIGPISTQPRSVFVRPVSQGTPVTKKVTFTVRNRAEPTNFEIEVPDNLESVIDYQVTPLEQPERVPETTRQYRLEVQVRPDAPSGRFSGDLVVKSDHPNAEALELPIQITIKNN